MFRNNSTAHDGQTALSQVFRDSLAARKDHLPREVHPRLSRPQSWHAIRTNTISGKRSEVLPNGTKHLFEPVNTSSFPFVCLDFITGKKPIRTGELRFHRTLICCEFQRMIPLSSVHSNATSFPCDFLCCVRTRMAEIESSMSWKPEAITIETTM
jgi:hypothetical protein